MDEQKAQQRFDEIRARMEIQAEYAQVQGQYELLKRVGEWLEQAQEDPSRLLRAVQILLTDPDRPGSGRSERLRALPLAGGGTAVLGEPRVQIETAQALVFSAFYAMEPDTTITPWMVSALDVFRCPDRSREYFEEWKRSPQVPGLGDAPVRPKMDALGAPPTMNFRALEINEGAWNWLVSNVPGAGWNWNTFSPHLVPVLQAFREAMITLPNTGATFRSELSQYLLKWTSSVQKYTQESLSEFRATSATQELLWWGQARYCHAVREPYRRVTRRAPEVALWWAAWETAQRATDLPPEPAAAYLVEVLSSVGQPIESDVRPLDEWMRSLHDVLSASEGASPVGETLAKLAGADALALPVTWVRLQTAKRATFDDEAGSAVGLDLSAKIDRGQWASWVFREIALDLVLQQSS